MLLTQNHRPKVSFSQHHLLHRQPVHHSQPRFFEPSNNLHRDLETIAVDESPRCLSPPPVSAQILASQFSGIQGIPLAALDSLPAFDLPRPPRQSPEVNFSTSSYPIAAAANDEAAPLFASLEMMQADSWLSPTAPMTPKSTGSRVSHQRESSLSSLGSTGPASPYSHNAANPHIAITDSTGDAFHGLPHTDDFNYHLAKTFPTTQDAFYANYPNYVPADVAAYVNIAAAAQRQKSERGLFPPDFPAQSRSRPVSVASSVASDSPATPSADVDDDKRRKIAFPTVPKLDRTMTDIYSDELYSPNFTITSASPSQAPPSPRNELFAQRLQAANSQHLSTSQSPVMTISRGRSPFRQGSPLAPAPAHEFPTVSSDLGFASGQQHVRGPISREVQVRQSVPSEHSTVSPQTISPKDAILEFQSPEGENNFPLFPQHDASGYDATNLKAVSPSQPFDNLQLDDASFAGYNQLPLSLQVPQQYPFIAQSCQPSSSVRNGSVGSPRMGSTESSQPDFAYSSNLRRPARTNADAGTYTCTYHGCTLRFETPALLQKHKREGHRQAHGLTSPRRSETTNDDMSLTFLNTQAGPHKCERINPSTGKPCNTVFSRPYDLTRHEDTIHNARKQKVRCNLCTDEKTFSRADALTRHYRVCHPDIEFPGKHRRRGGQGA